MADRSRVPRQQRPVWDRRPSRLSRDWYKDSPIRKLIERAKDWLSFAIRLAQLKSKSPRFVPPAPLAQLLLALRGGFEFMFDGFARLSAFCP